MRGEGGRESRGQERTRGRGEGESERRGREGGTEGERERERESKQYHADKTFAEFRRPLSQLLPLI